MTDAPFRSRVQDAIGSIPIGADGTELRNPEGFWESQGRYLKDFGSKALGLFDPGVELASDAGAALGDGNYGEAALAAPFLALNALGLKGAKAARSALSKPDGIPDVIRMPGGETAAAEPLGPLMEARTKYMRSAGIPETTVTATQKVDPSRAARVANEYDAMADDINAPGVRESYQSLADETLAQYQAVKDAGYKFRFMDRDANGNIVDPYAENPALGYKDLRDNKELSIFPTEGGFGTVNAAQANHPLLRDSGEMFGDQPATVNDLFRAVHDSFGHFGSGNAQFRAPGEDRAFQLHATMFSPKAHGAMASELRGQNSWVNYGPFGEANRTASAADTVYADQKAGIMPEWTWKEGMAETAPTNVPFMMMNPDEPQR